MGRSQDAASVIPKCRELPASSYSIGDAIESVKKLKTVGVAGIVTSPPYNKSFRGRGKKPGSNWKNSKLMADNYSHFDDNLPEDEYIKWQRKFLTAAVDCVGDDGVVIYNIGRRIKNLHEDRREAILNGFPVRQTVIWNRGSSLNQGGKRPTILPPIYELIYIIAGKNWRLPKRYVAEMRFWGDVWHITPEMRNPHPAPFPLELAIRMAKLVDGPIADPFAGSGTIGIAASEVGLPFYLNDLSPEYKQMFQARKNKHMHHKILAQLLAKQSTTRQKASDLPPPQPSTYEIEIEDACGSSKLSETITLYEIS